MRMTISIALVGLALSCASHGLLAQTLEVTRSPSSPTAQYLESGVAFDQPLAAFRLTATGGTVVVSALTLTCSGTGDFASDISEIEAWIDDGDGSFNGSLDQSIWLGSGTTSSVQMTFGTPITVAASTSEDIWVVASFAAIAGSSLGKSYQVTVANSSDVTVDVNSTAILGTPTPQSTIVTLVEFNVTSLDRRCHLNQLVLYGSGFTPPVEMYVGGQLISATAKVNANHTEVVFDYIEPSPRPVGDVLEISTASLGLKGTGYAVVWDCNHGRSYGTDGGCSAQDSSTRLLALVLTLLATVGVARFRKVQR